MLHPSRAQQKEVPRMSEPVTPQDHREPVEVFTYTTTDGGSVRLKPFKKLPAGVFRKAKAMSDMESTFALIEAATDEAGLAVVDEMEIGDLDDLFAKWSGASGVELPQS